jgi:CHASE2 domain-containing sensor protein
MKRYIITVAFSIVIVLIYQVIDVNLFSFDLNKKINNSLFTRFGETIGVDESILLCNSGTLSLEEIKTKIDTLIGYQPKTIGLNWCAKNKTEQRLLDSLASLEGIVVNSCSKNTSTASSIIIGEHNSVTHFKSDQKTYFEVALSNSWEQLKIRANKSERIYFRSPFKHYFQFELKDIDSSQSENFQGRIVLIGYLGDYVTEEMRDYRDCRITPMNEYFGDTNIPPDMYDTQISAIIISTINEGRFVNEINPIARVIFIILLCLVNVGLISLVQTRWLILNLLLSLIIFIGLMGFGSYLIVLLFSKYYYYIELDELTVLLIISTLFAVYSNIKDKKSKQFTIENP